MEAKQRSDLGEELYEACIQNQRQTVERLVGNRTSESDSNLLSSLMRTAVYHDAPEVVAFALERGAPVTDTLMIGIASSTSSACYRVLVEAKAIDINYYIPWYGDILSISATDNKLDWVKFCLDHGANPNKNLVDDEKTILAAVAEQGHLEVAELLVQNTECPARVRGSGAIVLAGEAGQTDMVKFLLAKGADVNELGLDDPLGKFPENEVGSALHKAIQNGHDDTALLLIEAGADVDLKDDKGRTPKQLAETLGRSGILKKMETK